LTTIAATTLLKRLVGRIRPGAHVLGAKTWNIRSLERNNALPSGDTAQAAAWATCLSLATGWWGWWAGVPCVAAARVYWGCHWWGDTAVGAAVGTAVASAWWAALNAACVAAGAGGTSSAWPDTDFPPRDLKAASSGGWTALCGAM
jgi:membrane-associated phospholipid phosphatase